MPANPDEQTRDEARPTIAICAEFEEWQPSPGRDRGYLKLYHHYYHALTRAGALPFIVPTFDDPELALELLRRADGVMLTGGDDFHAQDFGQELHDATRLTSSWRGAQDSLIAKWLLRESKQPVLAICAGMQALAIASGGSIVQDVPSMVPNAIEHRKGVRHRISVNRDSRLYAATGGAVDVNSYHHQAVGQIGAGLRPVALAEDGVLEAFESKIATRYLIGVQWHPELDASEMNNAKLFEGFVNASKTYARHETASDMPVNLP